MLHNLSFVKKGDYYSRVLIIFLLCIDIFSFAIAAKVVTSQSLSLVAEEFYPFVFISALSWIITTCYYKLYGRSKLKSIKAIFHKHLEALPLLVCLQLIAYIYINPATETLIPIMALNFYTIALAVLVKSILLFIYKESHQQFRSRYIIIGYSEMGQRLFDYLQQQKRHSHQFMGFFDDNYVDHSLHAGKIEEVYHYCKKHKISQIYLATNANASLVKKLADFADSQYIYFGYVVNQTQLQKSLLPYPETVPFSSAKQTGFQTIYV